MLLSVFLCFKLESAVNFDPIITKVMYPRATIRRSIKQRVMVEAMGNVQLIKCS